MLTVFQLYEMLTAFKSLLAKEGHITKHIFGLSEEKAQDSDPSEKMKTAARAIVEKISLAFSPSNLQISILCEPIQSYESIRFVKSKRTTTFYAVTEKEVQETVLWLNKTLKENFSKPLASLAEGSAPVSEYYIFEAIPAYAGNPPQIQLVVKGYGDASLPHMMNVFATDVFPELFKCLPTKDTEQDFSVTFQQASANAQVDQASYDKMIKRALEEKVIDTAEKDSGRTALHCAVQGRQYDKAAALLKAGAISMTDSYGQTPWDMAIDMQGFPEKLLSDLKESAKEKSKMPDAVVQSFNVKFRNASFGIVGQDEKEEERGTSSYEELLQQAVEVGAINARSPLTGNTALHMAVYGRQYAKIRKLIRVGARVYKNREGKYPGDIASLIHGFPLQLLLELLEVEMGFSYQPTFTVGAVEEVDNQLRRAAADPRVGSEAYGILVERAAELGVVDMPGESLGETALHIAVKNRQYDKARQLLEAGSAVFIEDPKGKTAADLATEMGGFPHLLLIALVMREADTVFNAIVDEKKPSAEILKWFDNVDSVMRTGLGLVDPFLPMAEFCRRESVRVPEDEAAEIKATKDVLVLLDKEISRGGENSFIEGLKEVRKIYQKMESDPLYRRMGFFYYEQVQGMRPHQLKLRLHSLLNTSTGLLGNLIFSALHVFKKTPASGTAEGIIGKASIQDIKKTLNNDWMKAWRKLCNLKFKQTLESSLVDLEETFASTRTSAAAAPAVEKEQAESKNESAAPREEVEVPPADVDPVCSF